MARQISLEVDFRDFFRSKAEQMALRELSLSIGKDTVDLVELRRTFAGPKLGHFASVPISKGEAAKRTTMTSPVAMAGMETEARHEQVVVAIRRALRESGVRPKRVVSHLPEEEVIVRYFQMPRLPKREWPQAVRFEARKYIPFTLEDLVSDFFVVDEKQEKGKMNVVFVAAKRQAVERHIALLAKASLQISHLEALPFSLMRLLQRLNQMPKEKTVGIVDVDGSSSTITLVKKGFPYLVRHVSLEVPAEQPEGMEAASLPSEGSASTLDPLLERLLGEVRLTLRYYRNQFPAEEVGGILFFGDGIKVGIEEDLSKELKLPVHVETLSAFSETGEAIPSRLARTLGMGLRGMFPSESDIDLFPKRTEMRRENKLFKICALETAGVLICLLAFFFVMGSRVASQQKILEVTKKGRVKSSYSEMAKEDLNARLGDIKIKSALYRELIDQRLLWTQKLNVMGATIPEGAWVTHMTINDPLEMERRMVLKGMAYAANKQEELKIPSQFLTSLKQHPEMFEGFQDGNLVSIKREMWDEIPVTVFEIILMSEVGSTPKSKRKGK